MPAANSTRPLSRRDQQLAKLKARRQGLAWSHAPAMPTPAPLQVGAAPLARPAAWDSKDQSIP